jgi:two-component system response regulator PilR (NtrC family)
VLIVDDEQSMREWMRILFQRDGFDVMVAEDGISAREILGREYVDVLLTDIRMPRMDGIELLRSSREIAPDTVVCMMTAQFTRDSEEWRRARDGGAVALFEKPFRDVNLVTLQVRQLIDARRVRHERDVLRQAISAQGFAGIVGRSSAMIEVFRLVETVCRFGPWPCSTQGIS